MKAKDNPFGSEHVTTIPFVFDSNPATTWARLEALKWHGAIVGPCGTGKTTLLEATQHYLEARGLNVVFWRLNTTQRYLPHNAWQQQLHEGDALLVDGVEQLRPWQWHRLRHLARHSGAFVVTSHRRTSLPVWLHTSTSPALLQHLVRDLGHPLSDERAKNLWHQHKGNLRLVLWQLYDEFAAIEEIFHHTY